MRFPNTTEARKKYRNIEADGSLESDLWDAKGRVAAGGASATIHALLNDPVFLETFVRCDNLAQSLELRHGTCIKFVKRPIRLFRYCSFLSIIYKIAPTAVHGPDGQ